MNESRRPLASFIVTLLLVGLVACEPAAIALAPTSASTPSAIPTQAGVAPPATVLPSSARTPSVIEGVLEAKGSLPSLHFYVLTDEGARQEVLPWLPVEVMQPPAGQSAPPTMADWVGQKVKLLGVWVQSESGLAFQVISAERQ